jgi:hypothetical protein
MHTYEEHYEACRSVYSKDNARTDGKYSSVYDITVDLDLFEKNDEYMRMINGIAKKAAVRMDNASTGEDSTCRIDPHSIRLKQALDIPEISEFAELIIPTIEKQVFHCNANVETVHIYRSIPGPGGHMRTGPTPQNKLWIPQEPAGGSWIWHYDDCPREFLKLMVYLNDVDEKSGCFRVLASPDGTMPTVETYRTSPDRPPDRRPQLYPRSRIPWQVVSEMLENGHRAVNIVGPAGLAALTTPNIYHRATIPSPDCKNPRDVMAFFIRPCLNKRESYVNKSTGTFENTRNVKSYPLD